jgi:Gene product 88
MGALRLDECLRTPEGTDVFVRTMIEAIDATGYLYMRVHDSGDLFSAAYSRAWIRSVPR